MLAVAMPAVGEAELITCSGNRANDAAIETPTGIREPLRRQAQPALQLATGHLRLLDDSLFAFVCQECVRLRMRADGHSGAAHLRDHFPAQRAQGVLPVLGYAEFR